jgi:hypothetical protein
MLTLLVEYVEDALMETRFDERRRDFLMELLVDLRAIEDSAVTASPEATIAALRAISDGQSSDFKSDDVLIHLNACVEELIRIAGGDGPTGKEYQRGAGR